MLKVSDLEVSYSRVILAARGVSLEVPRSGIVALLGGNGGGKSTVLKAISGLLGVEDGKVVRGTIEMEGHRIEDKGPQEIVQLGIVQVMEGRRLLEQLTVEQNLIVASRPSHTYKSNQQRDISRVYSYFPPLKELRRQTSGLLSGGEQQMLVMGRALMAHPKVILLDEPSLGLSPLVSGEIFRIIRVINDEDKMSILLVEQNVRVALEVADYGYVMENGRIALDGPSDKLRDNEDVKEFYLGFSVTRDRRNYREVKHYKRRKRWIG